MNRTFTHYTNAAPGYLTACTKKYFRMLLRAP